MAATSWSRNDFDTELEKGPFPLNIISPLYSLKGTSSRTLTLGAERKESILHVQSVRWKSSKTSNAIVDSGNEEVVPKSLPS
jgi:hypothetical protein